MEKRNESLSNDLAESAAYISLPVLIFTLLKPLISLYLIRELQRVK